MQVNQGNHSHGFKNLNTNSHQIESGILHNDCDCSSPQRAIVDWNCETNSILCITEEAGVKVNREDVKKNGG
jgi:hypothetical protein